MIRNIGIDIKQPKKEPSENEKNNPFNGSLSVRGKIFEGIIIKTKGKKTVVVQKESPIYFTKFRRYGRSKNTIHAHNPSNLDVQEGDRVIAAECRPISKTVSFVIVEVKK
jgi:small subunit ribosomal protein S17